MEQVKEGFTRAFGQTIAIVALVRGSDPAGLVTVIVKVIGSPAVYVVLFAVLVTDRFAVGIRGIVSG